MALFAGAGGGILGGHLLGWRCVCAVEWDAYAASVLVARQNDGCLPPFPIWDDVQTFDGRPWRGAVDVVSGGFPCQDISAAGKGAGIDGEKSGMWRHMARIIGEVRPRYCLVENSPLLVSRGLHRVLADLAALGYDARWGVVGAVDVGAPHQRERIWIVANSECHGRNRERVNAMPRTLGKEEQGEGCGGHPSPIPSPCRSADASNPAGIGREPWWPGHSEEGPEWSEPDRSGERLDLCDSDRERQQELDSPAFNDQSGQPGRGLTEGRCSRWWSAEPELGRVAHGVAHRVDRLRAIGNGQVPAVVQLAWEMLT